MKKNMKGKESLSDKISGANVGNWRDHKWIPAAFFENSKQSFKIPSEINNVYENYTDTPNDLPKDLADLSEEQNSYQNLREEDKKRLKVYGGEVQNQYLKAGLTSAEVDKRREEDGPNKLPDKKKTHWTVLLFHELTSVFSLLLWAAGILAIIAYILAPEDASNLYLGIVLWIVVLITGLFSFWQNSKSDSIIESFKSFNEAKARVVRNGVSMDISAVDLVVGDVVEVKTGEKIPADIRIFESNALAVNNSGLTGESEAIEIGLECGEKGMDNPLEARNLIFFSTLCTAGSGKGVVIRTGKNTFMGKIADLASSAEGQILTLEYEINRFIKIISIIAVTLGVAFFFGGIGIDFPIIVNFAFAIGIIVANVPEGLLSCLTVTLALTAQTLYTKNVMVKNMKSIETLGAITCICSDKTGTLTQNRMSVVHLWYDLKLRRTRNEEETTEIDGKIINFHKINTSDASFNKFHFTAVCGSASSFKKETPDDFPDLVNERNEFTKNHPKATSDKITEKINELKKKYQPKYENYYNSNIDDRHTDGDASEAGIIKFFEKIENIDLIRKRYPQHRVNNEDIKIPFSSKVKSAGFLRKVGDPDEDKESYFWLAFKGAPEKLIDKCSTYLLDGQEHNIDQNFQREFKFANKTFALKGERVLGLACKRLKKSQYPEDFEFLNDTSDPNTKKEKNSEKKPNYSTDSLCFVGLVAMEDPPRIGVKEAIATCKKAGIKVIMVTGDQTLTAASIAYQIGIIEDLNDTPEVIMANEGLKTIEEAERKSKSIIIDGPRLQRMMNYDEVLSDDNPNKGAYLRNWLMKRDVVFARTSPDQKLIIVDGCQKLSHIVAVTGDGVNDSPAIKKADIGIAMGKVGTDVAKDAADILLMDDNFANIVEGIRQGRIIFDNLKKIISYNLSSNIPELTPVIGFFIFAFPIPLTTVMILTIDIGSDVYPNVAFAYERAESSIMDRDPRNAKTENLCTIKLFLWSYLHMGMVEMTASFLAYFVVLHDYGFRLGGIFNITKQYGIEPAPGDVYNRYDIYKGNSNAFLYNNADYLGIEGLELEAVNQKRRLVDFVSENDNNYDLRLFLYELNHEDTWTVCAFPGRSQNDESELCYTVEAVRHAQSAYLANVILTQVANGFAYRTIVTSLFFHIMDNMNLNLAYILENVVVCCLLYIPGLNNAFGLRPILFIHWVPCLGVFITLFFYSELTKYLIRNVKEPDGSKGFFARYYRY